MQRLVPGGRFGKYEIVRELGDGHCATYYLASDAGSAPIVLKVFASDDDMLGMHVHDAGLAATFVHANLVQLHAADRIDGRWYFALEHVDGPTVRELCRRAPGRAWPLAVAVGVGLGLTAALTHLHGLRSRDGHPLFAVHRNLSPATVFITRAGVVKTNDFSITALGGGPAQPWRSRYLAPEQALGKPVHPRTDVFALGTLLYELTTGRAAFDRSDHLATLIAVRDAACAAPGEVVPGYAPALAQILARAMARDPEARHPTMAALERDLAGFARAEALDVGPGALAGFVAATAALG